MAKKYKIAYTEKQKNAHLAAWVFLWFFVFYLLYTLLTTFVFSTRSLDTDTMRPELHVGDRFICSSYSSLLNRTPSLRYGNIVIIDKSRQKPRSVADSLLEGVVRFFTAQRLNLFTQGEDSYIKRVIGLPGDEITMTNYVFRVRRRDDPYSYTEFELAEKPYDVTIPPGSSLWDESLPFFGSMGPIVLGDNECFVLSDDRNNTNDSRTWGPVSLDLIAGKVVFRYWPIFRIGIP
ncbi:MAG: signal peptidase I [Treponema sp.]|jgi:signal peptidase I|nr:signal peptidase I [Treponema sp.]